MSSLDTSKDFFNHVFNTSEDSKTEMMNIVQYSILSLIPVVGLNKMMSKYVPDADESKGSIEIGVEIVLQVVTMFIGILLIHRINTFVPTASGEKYPNINIISTILGVLMVIMSLQTKLGDKVSILSERAMQLWEGREGLTSQPAKINNDTQVRVTQPLVNNHAHNPHQQHQSPEQIAINSTPINSLPMNTPPTTQTSPIANQMMSSQLHPSQDQFEPTAANEGGGMFGAW